MAKCKDCQEEMNVDSCTCNILVLAEKNGAIINRYERSTYHFGESNGRCNDCGIVFGKLHHFGCDVERCPICGCQLISCECFEGKQMAMIYIESPDMIRLDTKKPVYPKFHSPVLYVKEIPKDQRNISGELYGVYDENFSDFVRSCKGVVLSRETIYAASTLMEAVKWGIERAHEKAKSVT